jgi:tRNA A-37 threonylcarbamoyl transferase component Bud32/membrane protein YdbS with pleckstrin-like domain
MPDNAGVMDCPHVSLRDMPPFEFILAGRYKLLGPLGEGGMASVYRGRDLRLNREVAIKILREDLTRDPLFAQRFEREAQFVASLSHPHIVPVYDVGEEDGTRYIVMEYVRGRTLAECIEREGKVPPGRATAILIPVLDALGYAHERGIIHRDVKPQNILLSADGTPRLADFGIAHLADASVTRTAAILGSAQYLSPEQSRGEEATPLSDIYACGIVLWEMIAGKPPFDGPNALAIANQHLRSPVPSLSALVPDIDPSIEDAVETALAKDAADRFEDTATFAEALRDAKVGDKARFDTLIQPLTLQDKHPLALVDPSNSRSRQTSLELRVRRSARKTYLLGLVLAAMAGAAVYAGAIEAKRAAFPAFPSAPYLVAPGAAIAIFLVAFVSTRSWLYSLDASAAVARWGVLAHHRFAVPLHQIASVRLKQSPLDRLIGVGTVELAGRDSDGIEERLIMQDIPHPKATYDQLLVRLAQSASGRHDQ